MSVPSPDHTGTRWENPDPSPVSLSRCPHGRPTSSNRSRASVLQWTGFVCVCVCVHARACVFRSSSCLCYPFSATLPWRQCPPRVMGTNEPELFILSSLLFYLLPSTDTFSFPPSLLPATSLALLPLSPFLPSFFLSPIGFTASSSKSDPA